MNTDPTFRYEQVAQLFSRKIDKGVLAPGARMPTVRAVSQQRGISASTVLQAYRKLRDRGVLVSRPRAGFFVGSPQVPGKPRAGNAIEVPAEVLNSIQVLKLRIDEHNTRANNLDNPIPIHDRRWKKIVRLLRTSAFLNGRNRVDLMDCFLMIHCLWSRPEQKELIEEMVGSISSRRAVNIFLVKV